MGGYLRPDGAAGKGRNGADSPARSPIWPGRRNGVRPRRRAHDFFKKRAAHRAQRKSREGAAL
jgi:hypothetical protein